MAAKLPFSEWPRAVKTMAAGIVALAGVIAAVTTIDSAVPRFVTRQEMLDELDKRRVVRVQETRDMIADAIAPLDKQLHFLRQDQLASRILSIQTAMSQLSGELVDMTLQDQKTPNTPIIIRRIREIEDKLDQLSAAQDDVQCQLDLLQGSGRTCQ